VKPAPVHAPLKGVHTEVEDQIRRMFERYGPTFVDLATGARTDMAALLEFYGAPLRFIGDDFHMVMTDEAALLGPEGMGGEIDRLRRAGFAASALDRCEIMLLNARAALVDALWTRRDAAGALMARFAVIYLVALTKGGWRITSAVAAASSPSAG
jgi:hypothetical protein